MTATKRVVSSEGDRFSVQILVHNQGMTYAREVHAGALRWTLGRLVQSIPKGHTLEQIARWVPSSASNVESGYEPFELGIPLAPFTTRSFGFSAFLPHPRGRQTWTVALWLGSGSSPPRWWELKFVSVGDFIAVTVSFAPVEDRLPEVSLTDE